MDLSILSKIGLTNNEVKVYLNLLKFGSIPAGVLIKKVELHRTCVYDTLERLIEKGIISYVIISNVKYFEAVNPAQLLNYLDHKKDEIDDYKKEVEKILPELEVKRKLSKEKQEASIFKGKKGLKSIFQDTLRAGKTMYVFGAQGKFRDIFPIYYHFFHRNRDFKMNIIYTEDVRSKQREKELKLIEQRFIPNEFDSPATTWIYDDKVAIVVWENQPIATLIRSEQVAKAYKNNFDLLWNIAKK